LFTVKPASEEVVPKYSSGYQTKEFFDNAYDGSGEGAYGADAISAISAHHLLIADEIARLFNSVGDKKTKQVVLLSPNHFSVGVSAAQITKESWDTPYGILETDSKAVDVLLDTVEVLKDEDLAFENEHGIGALTPFIKRSFPDAKLIPIILHESLSDEDAKELGGQIAELFPNAFVIASIDMSHTLPEHTQEYHDAVTQMVIASGDSDVDLEIDSNASLKTLFAFNEAKESQFWNQTHHGSSLEMGAASDWRENTSHILGYFTDGASEGQNFMSMHVVGDIMLDRGVRKQIDAAGDAHYPWDEMTRFLSGSHLRIGNLEGTVNEQPSTYTYDPPFRFVFDPSYVEEMAKYVDVVSLANNHASDVGSSGERETHDWLDGMGIPWFGSWANPTPRYDTTVNDFNLTFIGYHQFQPNEALLKEEIARADEEGRFVIVMPHWGAEYIHTPGSSQKYLAKLMVDAGADLIIGGHAHVVQGIQEIDGVPIVYSLGNFVFDQEIPQTWNAVTAGVILDGDSVTIQLMPVYTRYGQPTPLNDAESQDVLKIIADASDEDLQQQILNGKIIFEYE
jgi:AmmeMemoRadiSam system protein B